MTPQRQKSETIVMLVRLIEHQATRGPVLMIFEDAQWMDPSSGELLDSIIDSVHSFATLCVITCRPEFSPPWTESAHVTMRTLDRLGRDDVGRIVESVTGGKALPPQILTQILERTDGVPLFVEELTKMVLEAGILEESADGYVLEGSQPALSIWRLSP